MTRQPELLTYLEAAQILAVSRASIYRMVDAGHIVPVRLPVGGPRVRRTDLDEMMNASK